MTTGLRTWFDKAGPIAQSLAGLAAVLAVVVIVILLWRAARGLRGKKAADTLTVVAAAMASSVAATGMWHFFSRTMHLPTWIQAVLFAFMEIAVLASALRARANVARDGQAGADGAAVWVLTSASGLMSASEATSPQEALVRLGAPLVAAWLWERSMVPERRAQRAAKGTAEAAVAWLFNVKRIAVRLGLATALGADIETEDANRRIDRFVRADIKAQRAGRLTRRRAGRRRDRAHARLMEQARMQADPRALYAHLGRQAILDVLARLGGDDAVIDRERARQMEHILADAITAKNATAKTTGNTGASNPGNASATSSGAAASGPAVYAGPGGAQGRAYVPPAADPRFASAFTPDPAAATHQDPGPEPEAAPEPTPRQDELPLAMPAPAAAAAAPAAARANGAPPQPVRIPAARHATNPPVQASPAPPAQAAPAKGAVNGSNGNAPVNGRHSVNRRPITNQAVQFTAPQLPEPDPEPEPEPVYDAEPEYDYPGFTAALAAAPVTAPQPAPRRARPAQPPVEAPAYTNGADPGPAPHPEPEFEDSIRPALSSALTRRVIEAMSASRIPPNELKLAAALGVSIPELHDTLEALGGFDAVWSRSRQDRDADSPEDDMAFYSA